VPGDANVLDQEAQDTVALLTLKLDDLASLLIFGEGAIASKLLSDHAKSVLGIGKPRQRTGTRR
jgi:hypothetical protein